MASLRASLFENQEGIFSPDGGRVKAPGWWIGLSTYNLRNFTSNHLAQLYRMRWDIKKYLLSAKINHRRYLASNRAIDQPPRNSLG
jgi:hypothetical protein